MRLATVGAALFSWRVLRYTSWSPHTSTTCVSLPVKKKWYIYLVQDFSTSIAVKRGFGQNQPLTSLSFSTLCGLFRWRSAPHWWLPMINQVMLWFVHCDTCSCMWLGKAFRGRKKYTWNSNTYFRKYSHIRASALLVDRGAILVKTTCPQYEKYGVANSTTWNHIFKLKWRSRGA